MSANARTGELAPVGCATVDTGDEAYLRETEEFVRRQMEHLEGPVASVTCTIGFGDGAGCEVLLADGRSITCLVDIEEAMFAYFVSPGPSRPAAHGTPGQLEIDS